MNPSKQAKFVQQMLILTLLVLACVLLCGCGEKAQQKVYKVGVLSGLNYMVTMTDSFKAKMTELGYTEGKNIVYDVKRTNFEPNKEQQILKFFVYDKVDLIFVFPTAAVMRAKAATQGTEIPVVFAIATIEETRLIDSVRQPGGHITGVRYPGPDLAVKRFEIMHELAPQAKRMWIPYKKDSPIIAGQMGALYPVAEAVGVKLIEFPANDAAEIQAELDARSKLDDIGFDAMLFIAEPLTVTSDAFVVMGKFAYAHNLPIGGALMQAGNYGSIFGISVDVSKTGQQVAILADKILRGTPAGTIPVVSSESYLEINYEVAQKLGVSVSEGLLSRADRIIRLHNNPETGAEREQSISDNSSKKPE